MGYFLACLLLIFQENRFFPVAMKRQVIIESYHIFGGSQCRINIRTEIHIVDKTYLETFIKKYQPTSR